MLRTPLDGWNTQRAMNLPRHMDENEGPSLSRLTCRKLASISSESETPRSRA